MRIGLCALLSVAVIGPAVAGTPSTPAGPLRVAPLGGEVTVETADAATPVVDAASLRDNDVVRTGAAGRASISGADSWSAVLDASSSVAVRLLPETENGRTCFRRVLELREGAVAWKATAKSVLVLPFGRLVSSGLSVRVYFRGGNLHIDASEGEATFEGEAGNRYATLSTGHKINVRYDHKTVTFQIEVLEDGGNALDILIGTARFEATKGDVFKIRVEGANLDLLVERGIVVATGPDGASNEVGEGVIVTLKGAGEGAAEGRGPGRRSQRRVLVRVIVRDCVRDRTDVSGSGFK